MPDYALMNQHLYEGKAKEVEQMTRDALAEGRPVQEVLTDGLIAGMSVVGEDFKHNVLYVPEVLIAARAMKAGMAVLKPLLSAKDGGSSAVGVLLMGTVRGDLHDIGKNLVCMMAEGAGFEVHDIGVDQSVEKFMAAADKCQPTIIGMSALLTTTMTYMKTVIDGFEAAGRGHIKMAVGGAPISQMFADEIGADGYGQNASAAVDLFLKLASRPRPAPRSRPRDDHLQDSLLAGSALADQGRGRTRRGHALARPAIHGAHRPARRQAGAAERRRLPRAVAMGRGAAARRRGPGRRRGRQSPSSKPKRTGRGATRACRRSPSTDIASTSLRGARSSRPPRRQACAFPRRASPRASARSASSKSRRGDGSARAAKRARAAPEGRLPPLVPVRHRRRRGRHRVPHDAARPHAHRAARAEPAGQPQRDADRSCRDARGRAESSTGSAARSSTTPAARSTDSRWISGRRRSSSA